LNGENHVLEGFIVYVMLLTNYKVDGHVRASEKDVKYRRRYNLKKTTRRIRSTKRSVARQKIRSAKRAILILQFTKKLQNFSLIRTSLEFHGFIMIRRRRIMMWSSPTRHPGRARMIRASLGSYGSLATVIRAKRGRHPDKARIMVAKRPRHLESRI
jgi:hypothetical protein